MNSQSIRNKSVELCTLLKQYEVVRSQCMRRKCLYLLLIVLAGVALEYYLFVIVKAGLLPGIIGGFFFMFFVYYVSLPPEEISETYKNGILKLLLETWSSDYGCEFKYDEYYTPSTDIYASNPFFDFGNRLETMDRIFGEVGGVNFSLYGAELTFKSGRYTQKEFSGKVFEADMNVFFQHITIISKYTPAYLQQFDQPNFTKELISEKDTFLKSFHVFSTDSRVASSILTPDCKDCISYLDYVSRCIGSKYWGIICRNSKMEVYFSCGLAALVSQTKEVKLNRVYADYDLLDTLIQLSVIVKRNLSEI